MRIHVRAVTYGWLVCTSNDPDLPGGAVEKAKAWSDAALIHTAARLHNITFIPDIHH